MRVTDSAKVKKYVSFHLSPERLDFHLPVPHILNLGELSFPFLFLKHHIQLVAVLNHVMHYIPLQSLCPPLPRLRFSFLPWTLCAGWVSWLLQPLPASSQNLHARLHPGPRSVCPSCLGSVQSPYTLAELSTFSLCVP